MLGEDMQGDSGAKEKENFRKSMEYDEISV
jgi:hypothetical protein